jgi:hypothetical protein
MSRRPTLLRHGLSNRLLTLFLFLSLWSKAARAQDPLTTLPKNYSLVLDNSSVAVIRAHYGAHEKIPVHDHSSLSTVFVYLSDSGQVRIDHVEDDKPVSIVRPPTVKGSFRVAAGLAERHSIENLGDTSSDFLRVELKHVSLVLPEPFRGKAPRDPLQSQDSIEFTNPSLQIQRIICVGTAPCPVNPSPAPSLIVAFTPLNMTTGASQQNYKSDAGAVFWLPSSQAATITSDPASPTHILRILIPPVQK